ncbi:hypothetical protein ACWDUM_07105 [Rhodococcus sp. NPDC003322]
MAIHDAPLASGRSRGREIALNVGAIAGLICVLAAAASFFFGIKPLVFRSGSMSPDIPTGALALARTTPAADLAVGDVVSVENEQGTRITHRIHDIVSGDSTGAVLILKGDANRDADISPYPVTEADRVFFSVPGLGYAVSWLSSPAAIFLGGAFVGGLMVLAFGPASKSKDNESDSGDGGTPVAHQSIEKQVTHAHSGFDAHPTQFVTQPRQTMQIRRLMPARSLIALGAVGVTALGFTAVGTTAAFTDSAMATSSFSAAANFYPTPLVSNVTCSTSGTVGLRKATVSWTAPTGTPPLGGAWNYRVIVRRDNNASEVIDTYNQTSTTVSGYRAGTTARGYIVEVHTVNGPNVSTGWNGQGLWSGAVLDTYCSGGASGQPNPAGENSVSGQGTETQSMRMALGASPSPEAVAPSETSAAPTTTDAAASTTTVSAAPLTTTATPTAQASTTTTESTTTATPAPTTTTESTTTSAPSTTTGEESVEEAATAPSAGDLAITNTSTSGAYTATVSGTTATITDKAGARVFTTTVGKKAMVQWEASSDRLWIIDGDTLSVVDAASGTETSVDPTSGEVPAEVAVLVAK